MPLKADFRQELKKAMAISKRKQCNIVKCTTHGANYVSEFLKKDTNHTIDCAEAIANAVYFKLENVWTLMSNKEIKAYHKKINVPYEGE